MSARIGGLLALLSLVCLLSYGAGVFVTNLNAACLQCLCYASTGCNNTFGCIDGYCGPFYIARVYWVDAGRPVFPDDDAAREAAYIDCAEDYHCASTIVTNYMSRFGRDCDGDGVTSCLDYARVHYNGGAKCERSIAGTNFSRRFEVCRPAVTAGLAT